MEILVEFLSSHSGVITTILTTIGLVVVIIQLRENRRATQVQVIDSVFEKMNEILDRYYDTNPKIESEEGMRWLRRYFNTMEYMAALVNLKLVHKKTFVRLYGEAILRDIAAGAAAPPGAEMNHVPGLGKWAGQNQ